MSVLQQDPAKTTEPICTEFGGEMDQGPGENPLNLGPDLDCSLSSGVCCLKSVLVEFCTQLAALLVKVGILKSTFKAI